MEPILIHPAASIVSANAIQWKLRRQSLLERVHPPEPREDLVRAGVTKGYQLSTRVLRARLSNRAVRGRPLSPRGG